MILLFLSGCVHKMQIVNFETGTALDAKYNEANRMVTVVMPDGEILTGQYSAVSNASFSLGNTFGSATAYSGTSSASAYGSSTSYTLTSGGTSNAYALLRSNVSKLMMEVIVQYSEWNGHGFGEARTNDGKRFKVQF
ncbi:hypothetical protein [Sulfurimonas sp.]|uniref:hypothetical protein n=1 Tax=Sulfurimonas sp. TaxID=2022749 RepID=UPI0035679E65